MSRLAVNSIGLRRLALEAVNVGEVVKEERARRGKLPRSYLMSVGGFLDFWESVEPDQYEKLATRGMESALEAYCVDPSAAFAPICDARFSMHMSGTLAPLEEYRDTLGMPAGTNLMRVPSPFPDENLAVVYDPRFTTSHDVLGKDPGMLDSIAAMTERLINSANVNTGVFFTSFAMKDRVLDAMRGGLRGRRTFEEARGSTQAELTGLVERFKASQGGVLFAVMGGRIAEGLDFPGPEMEMALLVGVPYPKPTARSRGLVRFYDLKWNRGWEYAVRAPAARRLAQTVGRLIRNETDRGVAVLLDERGAQFRDALPLKPDMAPERIVRTFFGPGSRRGAQGQS
jgi:DNA excision repair protein ERCC-2